MLVEHDREKLVHRQQFLQRIGIQQFFCAASAQQISQRPVRIARSHQEFRIFQQTLVIVIQRFSADVTISTDNDKFNTITKAITIAKK